MSDLKRRANGRPYLVPACKHQLAFGWLDSVGGISEAKPIEAKLGCWWFGHDWEVCEIHPVAQCQRCGDKIGPDAPK